MIVRKARFTELDAATLYALLKLRCEVFVVEQQCGYLDLDGRDLEPETLHLWLSQGELPVAYLRILREADGSARIGRVVTEPANRGSGKATQLLNQALDLIGPATSCVIAAQAHLTEYYSRFGFLVTGAEYLEDGIRHVDMVRLAVDLPRDASCDAPQEAPADPTRTRPSPV
jgi:ElaA protein